MTGALLVSVSPEHAFDLARLHAQCFDEAWDAKALHGLIITPGFLGLIGSIGPNDPAQGFVLARSAADEAEILSIGVVPGFRGRGLGYELLSGLLGRLMALGASTVFLEVAAGNAAAQALYARAGFRLTGTRKGYYVRPGQPADDALLLRLDRPAP